MYLGEQLHTPSDTRLALSAQLGVAHIAVEAGRELDGGTEGYWSDAGVRRLQARARAVGIAVDVVGLETGPLLRDLVHGREEAADARFGLLEHNIRVAADAGVACLKYALHPGGVLRTGYTEGRGGVRYPRFAFADAANAGSAPSNSPADRHDLADVGPIPEAASWAALARVLDRLIPVAEACGVSLAWHPQDPPLPPGGVRGVEHVLGSVAGMRRYLAMSDSPCHVMNFCQGTLAEMCENPAAEVPELVREFGGTGRMAMVHFRNVRGGYGDFAEVYPDNGDVDMLAALRIYREVGYGGMICPDHVPVSDADPDRTRQFAFCLGYISALLSVVEREAGK